MLNFLIMQTRIQQIIYIILSLATLSGCISSDVSCDLSKDFLNTELNGLIEDIEKDYDMK